MLRIPLPKCVHATEKRSSISVRSSIVSTIRPNPVIITNVSKKDCIRTSLIKTFRSHLNEDWAVSSSLGKIWNHCQKCQEFLWKGQSSGPLLRGKGYQNPCYVGKLWLASCYMHFRRLSKTGWHFLRIEWARVKDSGHLIEWLHQNSQWFKQLIWKIWKRAVWHQVLRKCHRGNLWSKPRT